MTDDVGPPPDDAPQSAPPPVPPPVPITPPPPMTPPPPPPPVTEPVTPAAPPAQPKRLLRSRDDKMIAGVCAGLAHYLDVDVAIIRVATVILAFSGGAALLAYIIAWIAIPEARPGDLPPRSARPTDRASSDAARWIAGAVLIAIGGVWLIGNAFPFSLRFHALWPIVLIGVGVYIVVQGSRR